MTIFAKTAAALTLACTVFSGAAFADTYHHIDQLAVSVERQARQLQCAVSSHYRHTPEYGHLIADTRQLARVAEHMHEVAHDHGSLSHLQADLRQVDAAFHHLERTLEHIDEDSFRGHGYIHGSTSHVRRIMQSLEQTIHHLEDDVRSLNRVHFYDGHASPARPFGRINSSYYHSWPGHRSRGITIGGGSSRFTIRF